MFSKAIKTLKGNTALILTARFAVLFILSGLALLITANYLLERSQLERDRQLINSFIESYQRVEQQAGLHKMELVINRDAPFFQRSEMLVELTNAAGKLLIQVGPEGWQRPENLRNTNHQDWLHGELKSTGIHMLAREVILPSGAILLVGLSEAQRHAELAEYRQLVLLIMVPLMLFGLLLTAYMNWRALRPVHDLIHTVTAIRANNLNVRVDVRNSESELGELAQLFNEMLEQIERLVDSMRHSLDAVAHDLRTPLSRMRLSLEHALGTDNPTDVREALLDCAEESERIELMLRALMDQTEAENGMLRLHPQTVSLSVLLSECFDLYQYVAEEKGVSLQLQLTDDCELTADRMRLQQLIGNLLDNAIKYTEPEGQVELGVQCEPDRILLYVRDTGIGIPKQDQPLIFDRLYRADPSRSEPGMGLGLALVKAIVLAHQGDIRLNSEPGKGSCFTVILPRYAETHTSS
ncbi:sensor histidine kinase [Aliamphritea hakodatensis]|uniref:sensor histidine kinase n=1 Tax=Aliamphritea hakodatensis TaxID=2895352 RepID=UPI0022FD9156|nr:HAMP domain-containing sensor histidine kinase [Aliamphritea hakodatensis]